MTIPSVGSGLPPSSDPPPPGGNGEKLPDCFRSNVLLKNSIVIQLFLAIWLFVSAIVGVVFGVGCLVGSDDMCGDAGGFGLLQGLWLSFLAILALLPSRVRNCAKDKLLNILPNNSCCMTSNNSACTNRESRVSACLQKRECTELTGVARRIVAYIRPNSLVLRACSVIAAVLLLAYGISSVTMGSVCINSQISSSTLSPSSSSSSSSSESNTNSQNNACSPIAVMDICTSVLFILAGIGSLLSPYIGNVSRTSEAADVVELGEASPMLGDQPPPVGGESPGDQSPPVGSEDSGDQSPPVNDENPDDPPLPVSSNDGNSRESSSAE